MRRCCWSYCSGLPWGRGSSRGSLFGKLRRRPILRRYRRFHPIPAQQRDIRFDFQRHAGIAHGVRPTMGRPVLFPIPGDLVRQHPRRGLVPGETTLSSNTPISRPLCPHLPLHNPLHHPHSSNDNRANPNHHPLHPLHHPLRLPTFPANDHE